MDEDEIREELDDNNRNLLAEIEMFVHVKFSLSNMDSYGCQIHKNEHGEAEEAEIFHMIPTLSMHGFRTIYEIWQ